MNNRAFFILGIFPFIRNFSKDIKIRNEGTKWRVKFQKPFMNISPKPSRCLIKDQEILAFAGIYSNWRNSQNNDLIHSYSILTTEANELMKNSQ